MKRIILLWALLSVLLIGSAHAQTVETPGSNSNGLFVYTIGDIESYAAALNAVGMLFSDSSTGLVGSDQTTTGRPRFLGNIMAIGLLVSLVVVSVSGIMKQELRIDTLLVSLILCYAMFIPRTAIWLEDIYSGQVRKVDNIPIGIAWPASLISQFTYIASTKLEEAFSVPSIATMAAAGGAGGSRAGFMDPLKVLLAMREVNPCSSQRALCESLAYYMRYCLADTQGHQVDINAVMNSPDPMALLLQGTGVNALTIYKTDSGNSLNMSGYTYSPLQAAQGVTGNCSDAGAGIYSRTLDYVQNGGSGRTLASDLSAAMKERKLGATASGNAAPGTADTGGQNGGGRLETAMLGMQVAGLITDLRATQIAMAMRNPAIAALNAGQAPTPDTAYAVYMTTAMHQYQVDAAADGSMFLKTMLPSMSILTFFFFAFSPIIAMMAMMMGLQSIKIITSYLMFGLWTQSWMPGAVIVNYFMQLHFMGAMGGHGGSIKEMFTTWSHQPEMFDMLATNLAVASNMLAAVPVIMMALLSGSAYGLSSLADKMGASRKGYFDEKAVAPDLSVASNSSAWLKASADSGVAAQFGGVGGGSANMGYTDQMKATWGSYTLAATASNALSHQRQITAEAAKARTAAITDLATEGEKAGTSKRSSDKWVNSDSNAMNDYIKAGKGKEWQDGGRDTFGAKYQNADSTSVGVGLSAAKQVGDKGGSLKDMQKAFGDAYGQSMKDLLAGAGFSMFFKGDQSTQLAAAATSEKIAAYANKFSTGDGTDLNRIKSASNEHSASIDKTWGKDSGYSKAFQSLLSAGESLRSAESLTAGLAAAATMGANANVEGSGIVSGMTHGMNVSGRNEMMKGVAAEATKRANGKGKAAEGWAADLASAAAQGNPDMFARTLNEGTMSGDAATKHAAFNALADTGQRAQKATGGALMNKGQIDGFRSLAEYAYGDKEKNSQNALKEQVGANPASSAPVSNFKANPNNGYAGMSAKVEGNIERLTNDAKMGEVDADVRMNSQKNRNAAIGASNTSTVKAAVTKTANEGKAGVAGVQAGAGEFMKAHSNFAEKGKDYVGDVLNAIGAGSGVAALRQVFGSGGVAAATEAAGAGGAPKLGGPGGGGGGGGAANLMKQYVAATDSFEYPRGLPAPEGTPPASGGGGGAAAAEGGVGKTVKAVAQKLSTAGGGALAIGLIGVEAYNANDNANYAKAHGRPDLADEVLKQSAFRTAAGYGAGIVAGGVTSFTGPVALGVGVTAAVGGSLGGNWLYTTLNGRDPEHEIAKLRADNGDSGPLDPVTWAAQQKDVQNATGPEARKHQQKN